VRGDRILLEQVVVNLVQNAIHAQLEMLPSDRVIDIDATAQDGLVQIAIADHGPGIAPDQKDQLFTPFFSTKAEGLGLGLNICRTIVEAHGGHITVGNREGGGAVFTITLPSAKQAT
jgi:two-component system sensor histidine kinase DctS